MDRNEILYLATMSVAKKLLRNGLITEGEYLAFDTKMREKYAPKFGVLFSEIDLTNSEK